MFGTAAFQAPTHALNLNVEPAVAQALLKFPVLSSRPDCQHPIHLERRKCDGNSAVVIKSSVVGRGCKRGRTVVHVQQHCIKLSGSRTERNGDVIDLDLHPRIFQRILRPAVRAGRDSIPLPRGRARQRPLSRRVAAHRASREA